MTPKQLTARREKNTAKVARCRANKKLREAVAAAAAGGPAPKAEEETAAPQVAPLGEAGAPGSVPPGTWAPADQQAAHCYCPPHASLMQDDVWPVPDF